LSLTRAFEFGSAPNAEGRWNLVTAISSVVTKYVYTSELRGNFPGDSSGCRQYTHAGVPSGGGGSTTSEGDRCGGPINTNFGLTSSATVSLTHGKWNLATILVIGNSFHYHVDPNLEAGLDRSQVGQSDITWGIVSATYSFTDHLGVGIGLSSYQPALDSRYRHLRFPFFDLSGGAAVNNYTQAFVSLSGTL
jgi:hypothetical protein